jgi:hypothetical protein
VRIYELIIEPGREEHIARHHVSVAEVEEVVFGTPLYVERTMTSKEQAQPKVSKTKSRIPTFQTIEEEAAFWDSHSSEEFEDELTPVENVKFVKAGSKKALTVRFDEDTFEELTREAREKGIGPSTLARMVILEHLRARRAS